MTEEEKAELGKLIETNFKILPGDETGNADFHVGSSQPSEASHNLVFKCSQCGAPTFFDKPHPDMAKLCINCCFKLIKRDGIHEFLSNANSIDRALLRLDRN